MKRQRLTREDVLRILGAEFPYLSERFGVVRVVLYGSFARGDSRVDSDVDLLVELSRPLGLEFVALADYLEERLGRKVDVATFDAFHRATQKPHRQSLAENIEKDMTDVPAPTR